MESRGGAFSGPKCRCSCLCTRAGGVMVLVGQSAGVVVGVTEQWSAVDDGISGSKYRRSKYSKT